MLPPNDDQHMSDDDIDVRDVLVEQGYALVDAILRRRPLPEIKEMIKQGAPVWYQDDEGKSPLHAAAYVENDELVRFLVDEGALWNAGAFRSFCLTRQRCALAPG